MPNLLRCSRNIRIPRFRIAQRLARLKPRSAILGFTLLVSIPASVNCQVLSLEDAVTVAEANNRTILGAQLEKKKALEQVYVARTQRLPVFSLSALGSQPLSHLGLTLEKGSLGVYPMVGPIPGRTTTLENPLG